MSKIRKTNAWASAVACLAIALAAAGAAFAQQQSQQDQSDQTQQQSSDEKDQQKTQDEQNASQSDSQSDQQARERKQQERQRQKQTGERQQQAGEQDQQARERQQQARQREQQASERQQQASQRDQQGRDRDQQSSQRDQQSSQRDQQSSQRDQQSSQRERQTRQRDESPWDRAQGRGQQDWPQSSRSDFGDESLEFRGESQMRDEQEYSDTQRRTQRGDEQQAGLGVSVVSDNQEGVVVSRVHRGSPAEEMGIRTRDRITHVNGQEVQSVQGFISEIRNMEPGDEVELDIRRSGDERTVRGELESRDEALVLRVQQWGTEFGPPRRGQYGSQDRENWQTSYEEERGYDSSQRRSGQVSSSRIDQLQRQVDRMSQELEDLRYALQDVRRQSGGSREPGQWDRERTAGYDEYQRTIQSPRRSTDRWDDSNRFRQADRNRGVGRSTSEYDSGQQTQRSRQTDSGQSGERSSQSQSGQRGERSQSESDQSGERSSQYDSDQSGNQARDTQRDESPGGEVGEERLRVQSNERDRD